MISVPSFATLVRAANPGPMTLDGTNSWVLRGDAGVVVVDPGPSLSVHLDRLLSYGRVLLVLLTHGHADHAESAAELGARTDAPVVALDPLLCRHSEPFHDLDQLRVDGLPPLTVVATPGHTRDSVCFEIDGALLTGDTLLGRGSTMVGDPDGGLAYYLASLRRLAERSSAETVLLPGHGDPGGSVLEAADRGLAHRVERLEQVRRALGAGAQTAQQVLAEVYGEVEPGLVSATEATVRAQLAFLSAERATG
jgi:glyoxylase-like metal-dependent hydrolase (beta-lactamase superfamily II)